MVALDTLAYVRRLESAGVPRAQAEAHADAFAAFAADELATKRDLLEVEARLRSEIRELDIRLNARMDQQDLSLGARMDQLEARLNARMDQLEGPITIRLGGMLAAAIGLVAVLVQLF